MERHFNSLKHMQVTKAKEFETYKNLPKFTHVPMAVIHPSPRKLKKPDPSPEPDFNITGATAKLAVKKYEPRVFAEHLMRAPIDSGLSVSSPKRS